MSIVEVLLRAYDQTGPAFQSARAGLGSVAAASGQTSGGLAAVGAASSTTAVRIGVLTDRIRLQEQNLRILDSVLKTTSAGHAADSVQVQRAQLAYDRQTTSISQNTAALRRLESEQASASPALARTGSAIGGVTTALGSLGIAFGAAQVAQAGFAAIGAANSLEKTEATLRALSGTQERYDEVIRLSVAAQNLYGGTLQSQEENFRGLIPLSRSANVELGALDQTVRKLAILDPNSAQGGGAAIAIREFLTASDATGALSLQHRFELDKKALQELIKTYPDATERLTAFNALLAKQGITTEALTAASNTNAAVYDRLGASADRLKVKIGGLLSEGLLPYAESLTGVLKIASGDFSGGLESLYKGGNKALGYSPEETKARMSGSSMGWMGLGGAPAANVGAVPSGAPQMATIAPWTPSGAAGVSGGATGSAPTTVINQTINVAGSIRSEQELKDIAHQGLLEYQARNGGTGVRH